MQDWAALQKFDAKICSYIANFPGTPYNVIKDVPSLIDCVALAAEAGFTCASWMSIDGLCQGAFDMNLTPSPQFTSVHIGTAPKVVIKTTEAFVYSQMFQPMLSYGKLLGLSSPPVWSILDLLPYNDWASQIRFSKSFVNFTGHMHQKFIKEGTSFDFPCVLGKAQKGCGNYHCFGEMTPICDTSSTVFCENGVDIVSAGVVRRKGLLEAFLMAFSVTHNVEILATSLIVLSFLFLCMSSSERRDLDITGAELLAIVQERSGSSKAVKKELQGLTARIEHVEARIEHIGDA